MLINSYSTKPAPQLKTDALAIIGFDRPITRDCDDHIPTGLEITPNDTLLHELWKHSDAPVESGVTGLCHWSQAGGFLFSSIRVDAEDCNDLQGATERAYTELLAFITRSKQPNLLRFWNYLPGINTGDGDAENYKLFCTGRLKAFEAANIATADFPAATGIGHRTSGMIIYAISSEFTGTHHSNSQQQNAYQYPRQYGISSPSFARATSLEYPQGRCLFVSGTASIIGHKTLHAGNLAAQLEVTRANIEHLLEKADFQASHIQTMKVYVRHAADLAETQTILEGYFPQVSKVYTLADICRADLLVEVECFCS